MGEPELPQDRTQRLHSPRSMEQSKHLEGRDIKRFYRRQTEEREKLAAWVVSRTRLDPIKALSVPPPEPWGTIVAPKTIAEVRRDLNLGEEVPTIAWMDSAWRSWRGSGPTGSSAGARRGESGSSEVHSAVTGGLEPRPDGQRAGGPVGLENTGGELGTRVFWAEWTTRPVDGTSPDAGGNLGREIRSGRTQRGDDYADGHQRSYRDGIGRTDDSGEAPWKE